LEYFVALVEDALDFEVADLFGDALLEEPDPELEHPLLKGLILIRAVEQVGHHNPLALKFLRPHQFQAPLSFKSHQLTLNLRKPLNAGFVISQKRFDFLDVDVTILVELGGSVVEFVQLLGWVVLFYFGVEGEKLVVAF
jgi:hypothetical protein